MKSIAEDLNKTEAEATEIYNAVLNNIPGLRHFMEESDEMARQLGYVETKWGRRRYIPDMQLEPYIITSKGTKNFDPFFDSKELGVVDDVERLKQKYIKDLLNAKYFREKQKIKDNIEKDGFILKENTKRIEDASRQTVNSRVQGSAADQTKIAMRLIGTNEELKKLSFNMILLVHDEIIGEVPFVCAKRAIPKFQQCMLDAAKDLRTGAKCDTETTERWYGETIDLDKPFSEQIKNLVK